VHGTPPYHVRLVWRDKKGAVATEVVASNELWTTKSEARKALEDYLAKGSQKGVVILEVPTDDLKAKGLTIGPVIRTAEVWDASETPVSGYTARFDTEPRIPEAEKHLHPIVMQHFRQLDAAHGPWRVYLKFAPVGGGELLSRPLEKKSGIPVRYERLADLMITTIEMMKADFIPENGAVLTSGSHRAAAELPAGKFRFDAYARGEDGFVYTFPDAPDIEDAMN
jgi:hypothetical protein